MLMHYELCNDKYSRWIQQTRSLGARLHTADDAALRVNGMTQTLRGNDVIECWCIMRYVMTSTVVKYNKLVH